MKMDTEWNVSFSVILMNLGENSETFAYCYQCFEVFDISHLKITFTSHHPNFIGSCKENVVQYALQSRQGSAYNLQWLLDANFKV